MKQERKAINIQIGAHIRKYRELCGYSREMLAEKLNLSPRFVANIEVGAVGISPSTLKRTCEVLAIPADRLLWDNESALSLDERAKHLPQEYVDYLHKSLLVQIDMIDTMLHKNEEKGE